MDGIYRELTPKEIEYALDQKNSRTKYERYAYMLLPECMKVKAERRPPVAFVGSKAYFPDLFFRKEKICIEIDGGCHKKCVRKDKRRNRAFIKHGYKIIRIQNCDTCVAVSFWQQLIKGLEGLKKRSAFVSEAIKELRRMIDVKISSWAQTSDDDGYTSQKEFAEYYDFAVKLDECLFPENESTL